MGWTGGLFSRVSPQPSRMLEMKAVIFDLDGTLVDSAPDLHAAVNLMLQEEALAPLDLARVRGFIGNGVSVLVQRAMAAHGAAVAGDRLAALEARFMDHYARAPADRTRLFDGAKEAVRALSDRGYRLAVCTNKPVGPTHDILRAFGLSPHFQVVIGGDSLPVRKPDPAPLWRAVEDLGADQALYVGDSEVDAETAVAAAVPLVLFTEGYRRMPMDEMPHAAAFSSFNDLVGLVEQLLPM